MPLKVLCDENVPGAVIAALLEWKFDVQRVTPRTPDEDIAKMAKCDLCVLVTLDSDFANVLAYPPSEFFGIVRVKIDPPFPSLVIPSLRRVFDAFPTVEQLRGKLIIAEASAFRVWEESVKE